MEINGVKNGLIQLPDYITAFLVCLEWTKATGLSVDAMKAGAGSFAALQRLRCMLFRFEDRFDDHWRQTGELNQLAPAAFSNALFESGRLPNAQLCPHCVQPRGKAFDIVPLREPLQPILRDLTCSKQCPS